VQRTSFQLRKWYFDSADKNGNLLIAYAGKVNWKQLSLSFSSLLKKSYGEVPDTSSSLKKITIPDTTDEAARYENPLFKINIQTLYPPIRETLLEIPEGKIEWRCFFPGCRSSILSPDLTVHGLGYAEELIITIKPWEFKIKDLYWGRFVSENAYITWIIWEGEWKQLIVWHNGKKYESATFSETEMQFPFGSLSFTDVSVLRSGSLLSTVFKKFPLFKKVFPLKALLVDEKKWFAKGIFSDGKNMSEGYCVYEKVTWL
jgi:hypothetical protein